MRFLSSPFSPVGSYLRRNTLPVVALALVALIALSLSYQNARAYPEVDELSHFSGTFVDLKNFFTKLAEAKGAPYAYEILRRAALPPDTDLHLLGHVVGDELYKQQGVDGIQICTQEFRNACSHSIVVGAFYDHGEAALPLISEACKKAPGGPGAYGMCFHGLGHGVLASLSYNELDAIKLCAKTGTDEHFDEEFKQCVSGTVMELTGGGDHDKELWAVERMKYLSNTDPLAPCDKSYMPAEVKAMCYIYLTPHLFEFNGGSYAHPQEKEFTQAFVFCDRIPKEQRENRAACFGGIGKELPTLALSRDIRRIDQIEPAQMAQVYSWCRLGNSDEAVGGCIRQVVQSLFWGGENDPRAAAQFCTLVTDSTDHNACMSELLSAAQYYLARRDSKRAKTCLPFSGEDARICRERLLP